jgi:hypothetical protein
MNLHLTRNEPGEDAPVDSLPVTRANFHRSSGESRRL